MSYKNSPYTKQTFLSGLCEKNAHCGSIFFEDAVVISGCYCSDILTNFISELIEADLIMDGSNKKVKEPMSFLRNVFGERIISR